MIIGYIMYNETKEQLNISPKLRWQLFPSHNQVKVVLLIIKTSLFQLVNLGGNVR